MIARLSIEDRAFMFRKYTDMLRELLTAFGELLFYTLAPTDARNYDGEWDYHDVEKHTRKFDDIDAPFITKVCKTLELLHESMKNRRDEIAHLEERNEIACEMFKVWEETGMCVYDVQDYCLKKWAKQKEAALAAMDSETQHEQKGETSWALK